MHWIYLIHEFHNLSWITEINELFHDILIYWDAPVFHNDISPHFKFLFSNESLDFCDLKKIKDQKAYQCTFIFTAFFDHIYQGYEQFWPRVYIFRQRKRDLLTCNEYIYYNNNTNYYSNVFTIY